MAPPVIQHVAAIPLSTLRGFGRDAERGDPTRSSIPSGCDSLCVTIDSCDSLDPAGGQVSQGWHDVDVSVGTVEVSGDIVDLLRGAMPIKFFLLIQNSTLLCNYGA